MQYGETPDYGIPDMKERQAEERQRMIDSLNQTLNEDRQPTRFVPVERGRFIRPEEVTEEGLLALSQAQAFLDRRESIKIDRKLLIPISDEALILSGIWKFDIIAGKAWKGGGYAIIASFDVTQHGIMLHASISHKHRYPTWDEIKAMRDVIFPGVTDVMMILPRHDQYVNLQPNTFHLWSTPEGWGIM